MVSLTTLGGFWPSEAIVVADPYSLFHFETGFWIPDLTRFPGANRFLPPDQVRGHASLENALAGDARIAAIGPDPVADLRHVFAVLADIARMLDQGVAKLLFDIPSRDAEAGRALDDLDRQMEAA